MGAIASSDTWFSARVTNIQFAALARHLDLDDILSEIDRLSHFAGLRRGARCDDRIVRQWLVNGWNTEHLLRINVRNLDGDALAHSLHWAFPQAYYSAFALALAYFQAVGYTEQSHAAVIRKLGLEMRSGRYPATLAFLCDGGRVRTFHNIAEVKLPNTLQFDCTSRDDCIGRICQFLNATREQDLHAKREAMQFKTASGAQKKRLAEDDWERVSSAQGPTSLLSLLYRKRIKANYRSIDSYLSGDIDAKALYRDLIHTVEAANFVHELYIARALGQGGMASVFDPRLRNGYPFLSQRLAMAEARSA